MEELLNLLRDGRSRSMEMLAEELGTSVADIARRVEFLERAGIIRLAKNVNGDCHGSCSNGGHCKGCKSSSSSSCGAACASCAPKGGFKNMGKMWEVV